MLCKLVGFFFAHPDSGDVCFFLGGIPGTLERSRCLSGSIGAAKAIDVIYLQREVEWLQQVPWLEFKLSYEYLKEAATKRVMFKKWPQDVYDVSNTITIRFFFGVFFGNRMCERDSLTLQMQQCIPSF